ncbi:ABC transporter ATP-binding protein [Priestia flexa]|uniref:ABC transporter ATP-binding protein n=1 Tax=Priestia flexa TaxID=86664 RepID=A0A8I1SPZ3_9BACI|nr:ABC transporter ATP-binding protein [Priestia flexa]MBN8253278.1 ABC transporter ATP-binding protein [Priestia flexa]MBN8435702.1 ABC transporter ATP-binding protein [Priestia flexa]MCA0968258.1 ABC transporter ATP-binding protein [Priestia flexa]UIR31402.1 ABC transporter ATP-binding protein [Priestia flexa]
MLNVCEVEKSYPSGGLLPKEKKQIIKRVSFECAAGECLGIIGESGSGKSTLGRLILGIERPDKGEVLLDGVSTENVQARVGKMSAVFQNYASSINPFFTVKKTIMESLRIVKIQKADQEKEIEKLLHQVGLPAFYKHKYPHELSGGEAQRVCIARAIATKPKYLLLDEAVSSLDISVQLQILTLLKELRSAYDMSYIFITHDLQAATYLCDRLMIFKEGQVEEVVSVNNLKNVKSSYAKALLNKTISL